MANYVFILHHRDGDEPFKELLELECEEDAADLAKVTLLGMAGYTHAEVFRGSRLVTVCHRDSQTAQTAPPRLRTEPEVRRDI